MNNAEHKSKNVVLTRTAPVEADQPNLHEVRDNTVNCVVFETQNRARWQNKMHFYATLVAYAVGLGNVWRFPLLAKKHGGGAFLIPYFIMLFVEGIPLFLLELSVGQKLRLGSIGVWNQFHPLLSGLGIASATVTFLIGLYYNTVIAWCLYYVYSSVAWTLPWATCPNVTGEMHGHSYDSATIMPTNTAAVERITDDVDECRRAESLPSTYFWYRKVLDISDRIEYLDGMNWPLSACFAVVWVLVFLCLYRGIKSSGRIIIFIAVFPYIILTIMFVRAITLNGALFGVARLFIPDMSVLLKPIVWLEAATQIFYSLGIGFGSLISFGSFSERTENVRRDTITVSLVNCMTSVYAAVIIFAVLGYEGYTKYERCMDEFFKAAEVEHSGLFSDLKSRAGFNMAQQYEAIRNHNFVYNNVSVMPQPELMNCFEHQRDLPKEEGPGLAFFVFADALSKMPGASFWSFIFYSMLFVLGIGSHIGGLEGCINAIHDLKLFSWLKRYVVTAIVCVVSCVLGQIFLTRAGEYWVQLFNDYSGTFSLTTIALCETIAVAWIYGFDRFADDVHEMCGIRLGLYWKMTIKWISPVLLSTFIIWSLVSQIEMGLIYSRYDKVIGATVREPYPMVAVAVAAVLVIAGLLPLPLVAVLEYFNVISIAKRFTLRNGGGSASPSPPPSDEEVLQKMLWKFSGSSMTALHYAENGGAADINTPVLITPSGGALRKYNNKLSLL